jgi:tRNA A-37 threonylcarbamoyl transferase component Bud32
VSSSDSIDQARFTPGTMLTERYRIVGLLGEGGMGEVYRADDLKLRQPVALKFLPKALADDPRRLERFLNEVRVARQVSHPNVCRVYDIGEVGGEHFISMEYVDGEDLASLVRRIGRLPKDKAVQIARQLCVGLASAHDKGILHRDLKPHNVMIDGQGKVRITDFGLAGFVGQFLPGGKDIRVGTPAYMAPEQLEGREVTVKSDIYSLGLLLYHVFTGQPAYKADTCEELLRIRGETSISSPSNIVEDIDPAVERVILECLEEDPGDRPVSAIAVAVALPGGDPLAAAIAAGETPSPEMVAASGQTGSLSLGAGLTLLVSILVGMGLIALLGTHVTWAAVVLPEKAPILLADDAARLARRLGYVDPPADWAYGVAWGEASASFFDRTDPAAGRLDPMGGGYFWYRQSGTQLVPANVEGRVTLSDPPRSGPGMLTVILDAQARLTKFEATAPPLPKPGDQPEELDWTILSAKAGLDLAGFTPVAPVRAPPVACDTQLAWVGSHPDDPGKEARVEAAALRGKPVYFELLKPGDSAGAEAGVLSQRGVAKTVLEALAFFVRIVVIVACVVFAWRNLKLGRGDRRGATRLALCLFALAFVRQLLVAKYTGPNLAEYRTLVHILAMSLYAGVFSWALYLAVEPYARRAWPERIVSWTRLLTGRLRDPLIGRDILAGLLISVLTVVLCQLISLAGQSFGLEGARFPYWESPEANLSMRHFVATILLSVESKGVGIALWVLFLIVALLTLCRRRRVAIPAFVLVAFLVTCSTASRGDPLLVMATVGVWTAGISISVLRFGLLTYAVAHISYLVYWHFPLTLDFSAWYAGNVWFAALIIAVLAVYALYISLAGRPLIRNALRERL